MFAQAFDWTSAAGSFVQMGVAGSMLLWFATRLESRIKSAERSIDRMARAQLLWLVSVGQLDNTIKQQAQALKDEIDRKENEE